VVSIAILTLPLPLSSSLLLLLHTGERPFKCTVNGCYKSFTSEGKMRAHVRAHDKPYACQSCGRKFGYSVDLKRHVEKKHGLLATSTTTTTTSQRGRRVTMTKEV